MRIAPNEAKRQVRAAISEALAAPRRARAALRAHPWLSGMVEGRGVLREKLAVARADISFVVMHRTQGWIWISCSVGGFGVSEWSLKTVKLHLCENIRLTNVGWVLGAVDLGCTVRALPPEIIMTCRIQSAYSQTK